MDKSIWAMFKTNKSSASEKALNKEHRKRQMKNLRTKKENKIKNKKKNITPLIDFRQGLRLQKPNPKLDITLKQNLKYYQQRSTKYTTLRI